MIETTRCSQSQAELALYDNDNDLAAAVDYILEHAAEAECWTEQKSKKEKKKDEDERKPISRMLPARGRGGFSDRGGRGRGQSNSRGGATRVVSSGPSGGRGRGGSTVNRGESRRTEPQPKPAETTTETAEETNDWVCCYD